jgi:hypothetical protein
MVSRIPPEHQYSFPPPEKPEVLAWIAEFRALKKKPGLVLNGIIDEGHVIWQQLGNNTLSLSMLTGPEKFRGEMYACGLAFRCKSLKARPAAVRVPSDFYRQALRFYLGDDFDIEIKEGMKSPYVK